MNTLRISFPQFGFATGLGHALASMQARVVQVRKLRETRRYLAQMDDHMLADIGVSRAQAGFELDHATLRQMSR